MASLEHGVSWPARRHTQLPVSQVSPPQSALVSQWPPLGAHAPAPSPSSAQWPLAQSPSLAQVSQTVAVPLPLVPELPLDAPCPLLPDVPDPLAAPAELPLEPLVLPPQPQTAIARRTANHACRARMKLRRKGRRPSRALWAAAIQAVNAGPSARRLFYCWLQAGMAVNPGSVLRSLSCVLQVESQPLATAELIQHVPLGP